MYKIMRHLAEKLYEYEDLEEQGLRYVNYSQNSSLTNSSMYKKKRLL